MRRQMLRLLRLLLLWCRLRYRLHQHRRQCVRLRRR
jgi:hypothetical protein